MINTSMRLKEDRLNTKLYFQLYNHTVAWVLEAIF